MKLEPWATITGRLVQAGRPVGGQSIYYYPLVKRGLTEARFQDLVSRDRGVEYPEEATPLSFDPSGNLQPAWLRQPDFQSWVARTAC